MENLKKIYDFLAICVFIMAAIGGTAYLFYYKQCLFGVTNLALVAMATPYIIRTIKDIQSRGDESFD